MANLFKDMKAQLVYHGEFYNIRERSLTNLFKGRLILKNDMQTTTAHKWPNWVFGRKICKVLQS